MSTAHRAFDGTYWRERNDAACEDLSIQRYRPDLEAALTEMKSNPEIGALHNEAVALHRAKRDTLQAEPAYRAMQNQLRNTSPLPPTEEALLQSLGVVA